MIKSVRIIIADDHSLLRNALELILSGHKGYQVVGKAAHGAEVMQLLQETLVDVVLMDMQMPVMDGLEATARIKTSYPWIKVIALSMQKDSASIRSFMEAGARGYVTKYAAADELIQVIEGVLAGRELLSEDAQKEIDESRTEDLSNHIPSLKQLTDREKEIVQLIVTSNTTDQIAGVLGLSMKTIEAHRRNIYRKLGIQKVTQLITLANSQSNK